MNSLEICEIFYSLQGESSHAGRPCAFIRLSGCNLSCSYCDTRQSWAQGKRMDFSQIRRELAAYPVKLVEFTGGEPLLQDEACELMPLLHDDGYEILLETNGSLYLGDVPDYVAKIVDVKCPGSGWGGSFPKWNLRFLQPHDELKFVLTSHIDYSFALDFIREHKLGGRMIHFSPVTSVLPAETLAAWMLADGAPARLQLQLHKILRLS